MSKSVPPAAIMLFAVITSGSPIAFASARTPQRTPIPSLTFAGYGMKLGDPIDQVVSHFQEQYKVQMMVQKEGRQSWWVMPRNEMVPLIEIYARHNTVVGLDLDLADLDTPDKLFGALFEAVTNVKAKGASTCGLDTFSNFVPRPSLNKSGVSFSCKDYTFYVIRLDFKEESGRSSTDYNLHEVIGETE